MNDETEESPKSPKVKSKLLSQSSPDVEGSPRKKKNAKLISKIGEYVFIHFFFLNNFDNLSVFNLTKVFIIIY
jgi:hypothetical protein